MMGGGDVGMDAELVQAGPELTDPQPHTTTPLTKPTPQPEQVRALLERAASAARCLDSCDSEGFNPSDSDIADGIDIIGELSAALTAEREAHAATRADNDRLRAALAEAEALAEEGRGVLKTLWVYLQYAERYHKLDAQLLRSHRYTDKWRQALEARDTVGLDMDAALVEVLKIAPVRLEALATAQGEKGGA